MRMRSRGWRSIAAFAVPPETSAPTTTARYCRCTPRADSCATSAVCAGSVRATTMTPEVSLSSRWTMPARGSADQRRIAMQQRVDQRARRIAGARMHHQARRACRSRSPARPRTARRAAMSSGAASVCVSSTTSSDTVSPPRTGSRPRTLRPSSRASPDLIQAAQARAGELREQLGDHRVEAATGGRLGHARGQGLGGAGGRGRHAAVRSWEGGRVKGGSARTAIIGASCPGAFVATP